MLIDHQDQQTWGPTKQKMRKTQILAFTSQRHTMWSQKYQLAARRETHWIARSQNFEGPAAARAGSRAACGGGEWARRSESTYAQQVDMISRIVAHNRLCHGSLDNATCARGTDWAKLNAWRGKSRLFSRFSLVSRFNWVARHQMKLEWIITARQAVLRLAQIKYRYFVPERCKLNAIFSGTSHQNRSCLDNISKNRWCIVGWQHGHCSRYVTDENFELTLHTKKAQTSKFSEQPLFYSVLRLTQFIDSVMKGLPTLQNYLCQIGQIGNSIIWEIKIGSF